MLDLLAYASLGWLAGTLIGRVVVCGLRAADRLGWLDQADGACGLGWLWFLRCSQTMSWAICNGRDPFRPGDGTRGAGPVCPIHRTPAEDHCPCLD